MAHEPDRRSAAESRFAAVFAHLGLITAVVFGATGGAFGLGGFPHASPKALFDANPAGPFPWRPGKGVIVPDVIPQTVRLATTFTFRGWAGFSCGSP